jgi:hypothetical protein
MTASNEVSSSRVTDGTERLHRRPEPLFTSYPRKDLVSRWYRCGLAEAAWPLELPNLVIVGFHDFFQGVDGGRLTRGSTCVRGAHRAHR